MNIPDRWIPLLDMLSDKDLATLMRAILHGEEEPTLAGKNQSVADLIYSDIAKAKYFAEAKRKSRKKFDGQTIVKEMSNDCQRDVKEMSIDSQTNVKQEEKKEKASPPSSPSSSPPHPLNNTPYNPPLEREKREDSPRSLTLTNPPRGDTASEEAENQADISLSERFNALWESYPRKMGKKKAYESYLRAVKHGISDDTIREGIAKYNAYLTSEKVNMQFVKLGSTWFAGECWNDEYDISARQLTADEEREYQELWGG